MLGGLWALHSGSIKRPLAVGQNGIFFVPQNSYTTEGSLREQILYPECPGETEVDDEALHEILRTVDLEYLFQKHGMDNPMPWADMLSGGEQQRLGFARLFYHRPQFAIMDEAAVTFDAQP